MKSMLTIDNRAWHAQLLAEGVAKGRGEGKGRRTDFSPGGEIRRGGTVPAEANPWSQAGNPGTLVQACHRCTGPALSLQRAALR